MRLGAGLFVSTAVGLYAAVWLSSPGARDAPVLCAFGMCRDAEAAEAAHEGLRSTSSEAHDESLRVFPHILRRNPGSPYAWCDAGDALLETGDMERARRCFRRAGELGPDIPPVLLRIFNFHCRTIETAQALAVSRRILQLSGEYDQILFGLFSRLRINVYNVLADGIGDNPRATNAFMRYMLNQAHLADAQSAWRWLGKGTAIEPAAALQYVSTMWESGHREESASAWSQRFGGAEDGYRRSNFVFNGSFERQLSRSVFDWIHHAEPYADISVDSKVAFRGGRSLKLDFNGTINADYQGPRQIVWVIPGMYRFQAQLRSEGISSDQGLRFQFLDAERPGAVLGETDQVLGTTDWHEIATAVVVPPGTRVLELRLIRKRSWKFDNLLDGTLWVDDVTLSPAQANRR